MATVTSGSSISAVLVRVGVALAHLALVPGLFEVSHPSWIGRYYWYQAVSSRTGTQREASLEKAIHRDPALSGVWLRWSQAAESRGDLLEAWRRLIQGLVINPSSAPLIDSTRRLWRHLDSGSRQEAEMILAQYFGRRSILWLNQIRAEVPTENQNSNENVIKLEKTIDPHEFSLDRKLELPLLQEFPVQPNLRDPKRLDLGNDAVEGRTL
jgi:hypothetical protein